MILENRNQVLLRDITERITKGSTPTSYGYSYKKEGIRFIKAENIDSKGLASTITDYIDEETHQFLKRSILKVNDILFSIAGTIGRIGIVRTVDLPANTNQALAIIRPQTDVIDSKYLFHFLNSPIILQQTKKKMVGVGRANISLADLGDFEVWLPPTIEDQKRIVAEIEIQFSRLDEAVASLKRIQANLKRYKAAVLKAAVEGKLTEQWRKDHPDVEPADQLLKRILAERRAKWEAEELAKMKAKGSKPKDDSWKKKYKEPAGPDTANLSELPEGWVWAALGQLAWSVKDGPHYSPKYSASGIPFISGGNIRPEGIDLSSAKFITSELHAELSLRCKPEHGDLLYTKGGTTGIARINTETRDFNVWVHVAVLKLVDSIEPFYLQNSLNSTHCYKQSQQYTHGVGNQDLGLTRMVWITVPLPPLTEQQFITEEIDRRLSVTKELEVTIEINLKRAERLRQTILSRVFTKKHF